MKNSKDRTAAPTPGFAISLTDQTELGIAMLIAEDDAGNYLPVGPVSTLAEAREVARNDLRMRMDEVEEGGWPFCLAVYRVWAHGIAGYAIAAELQVAEV